ncbi:MAG: hypothetical protein ACYCYA_04990 [Actinomycetes bacterium]
MYAERIVRFADSVEVLEEKVGAGWASAADMSRWTLDLSVGEAEELGRRLQQLCAPYRHDTDRPRPGTRSVVVQFQVLPTGEENP